MPFLALGISAGTGLFNGILGYSASQNAASTQSDAEKQLLALINQELPQANSTIAQGTTNANNTLGQFYQQNMALLAPYLQAGGQAEGQLSTDLQPGGSLNTNPSADTILAQDPGYQFRLQQGELALDRSAAAKGDVLGGGQLKALTQYGQDYASNEYSNAFQRYNTTQSNLFNRLNTVAGTGLSATQTGVGAGTTTAGAESGNITAGAGQQASDILQSLGIEGNAITGAANATASGYVGGANAVSGAAMSTANSFTNFENQQTQSALLQKLLSSLTPKAA